MNIEEIRQLIHYDPYTGKFFWKRSNHSKQVIGQELGSLNTIGYYTLSLNKHIYYAHRVAWALVMGEWPKGVIDHINGNKADNSFWNLRDTTYRINQENRTKAQANSSSKLLGAFKYKNGFRSQIKVKGQLHYLGVFPTAEEAHQAYISAKQKLHEGNTL